MSPRSISFRNQAAACRQHANLMIDVETKVQLRELADEFIVRALEIEAQAGAAYQASRSPLVLWIEHMPLAVDHIAMLRRVQMSD
jgi:hypothetical protein